MSAPRPIPSTRLVYRRVPVPVRERPPQKIIRQTIRQNVIHIHQTILNRYVRQNFMAAHYLRQDAYMLLLPPAVGRARVESDDLSRPGRAARRLRRLFSGESVRRELRPFYGEVVRGVLREEQERYRSRPTQAISLIWDLFGRRQAFRTLTRFYMSVVERLGGNYYPALSSSNALFLAANVLLKSRVYRQYVRNFHYREGEALTARYLPRQRLDAGELSLLAVRRAAPLRETVEEAARQNGQTGPRVEDSAQRGARMDEAQFRALVRDVARSLEREARLERLRRGEF